MGRNKASKLGMPGSTLRNTSPTQPRWRNALHAESTEAGDAVHEVGLVQLPERVLTVTGNDRGCDALGVGRFDRVERRLAQPTVHPKARARAHLHVHVGRALLHRVCQQLIEFHGDPPEPVSTGGSPT